MYTVLTSFGQPRGWGAVVSDGRMKGVSPEVKRHSIALTAFLTVLSLAVILWPAIAGAAAPAVSVTSPLSGAAVAGSVPVKVSAESTQATAPGVVLLVNDAATTLAPTTSGSSPTYTADFTWDSKAYANGSYRLAARMSDAATTGLTSSPVTVTVENPKLTEVGASPAVFSPNNDGNADITTLSYVLATDSTVTIVAKSHDGSVVVGTLVSAEHQGAGAHSVVWDGLVSGRPDLMNGAYKLEITAAHLSQSVSASAGVTIKVAKARAKIWPNVAGFVPAQGPVKINVRLYDWAYLQVGVYRTNGALVKTLLAKTLKAKKLGKGYRYVWDGRTNSGAKAHPGMFILKAIVRNQAGTAIYTGTVRIHGEKHILIIKGLLRIYWMEGNDPLPGPKWADWKLNGAKVAVFPDAMGKAGWRTPSGNTFVERKAKWPTWYPPAWAGLSSPVGPGKSNPLGPRALYLSPKGYTDGIRIHGTNNPSSIGTYASHSCIRMYPKDVIWLYDQVPVGTHVTIVQKLPAGITLVGPNHPSPGLSRRWY